MCEGKLRLFYEKQCFITATETTRWVLKEKVGYSPVENLVNSMGACCGYVYEAVLSNSKIPHTFKKIEMTYRRQTDRRAHPLEKVEVHFYLEVEEELQAKALRCLRLVLPNCPVVQSLDPAIKIEEQVHFV